VLERATVSVTKVAAYTVAGIGVWELAWWARRRARRSAQYEAAFVRAQTLHRQLVVIGAPDGGSTGGYGCGDVVVDLAPSSCAVVLHNDVTKALPFATNSVVVFCSCVLEYVSDADAALREIWRISGGQAFFVGVEPWTLTAYFYPGARRTLPTEFR
jgi:hypothetical protein